MPETSSPCRIGMTFLPENGRLKGLRRRRSEFRIGPIRHISADSQGNYSCETVSVRQSEWVKMANAASEKSRKKFPGRTSGWPICHLSERNDGKDAAGRVRSSRPVSRTPDRPVPGIACLTRPSAEALLVPLGPSDPATIRAARPLGHAVTFLGWPQHGSQNGGKVQLPLEHRCARRRLSTSSDHV